MQEMASENIGIIRSGSGTFKRSRTISESYVKENKMVRQINLIAVIPAA